MHELAERLSVLDPEAAAAVETVARFDALMSDRAGLETVLRAVVTITGHAVRLTEREHGVELRLDRRGRASRVEVSLDPAWLGVPVFPGGRPALWLEHTDAHSVVESTVLDRASFAVREILIRTRRRRAVADPAAVEVLLDSSASEVARRHAASQLGLPIDGTARAVASESGPGQVDHSPDPVVDRWQGRGRVGIGPRTTILELPVSWQQAEVALRLAAEGTGRDPGPQVVLADELGGLALLAEVMPRPGGRPPPDVDALEGAAAAAPWVLETVVAFTSHASLRLAAAALFLHHSTLQDRIGAIERDLGWRVRDPQGRLRLQMAIAARRLLRHPAVAR